jgi:hypothetical protein
MREELAALVHRSAEPLQTGNLAREYLQARLLLALQESGAMIPLAFQGGTALRFLYDLPRFSEDLDFALERATAGFDLPSIAEGVSTRLVREGYAVTVKLRGERAVQRALVVFPGLPHALGLSPHRNQRLAIRVDVDTRPPAGAVLATTIVRRHVVLNLQHHDRASLLAGKLHAVLQRGWPKGRDLFDLFWYLSDPRWPPPNLELLNNALAQTGWRGSQLGADDWRAAVRGKVGSLDWSAAEADVAPFLEPGPAAALFGRETLLSLLDR